MEGWQPLVLKDDGGNCKVLQRTLSKRIDTSSTCHKWTSLVIATRALWSPLQWSFSMGKWSLVPIDIAPIGWWWTEDRTYCWKSHDTIFSRKLAESPDESPLQPPQRFRKQREQPTRQEIFIFFRKEVDLRVCIFQSAVCCCLTHRHPAEILAMTIHKIQSSHPY